MSEERIHTKSRMQQKCHFTRNGLARKLRLQQSRSPGAIIKSYIFSKVLPDELSIMIFHIEFCVYPSHYPMYSRMAALTSKRESNLPRMYPLLSSHEFGATYVCYPDKYIHITYQMVFGSVEDDCERLKHPQKTHIIAPLR